MKQLRQHTGTLIAVLWLSALANESHSAEATPTPNPFAAMWPPMCQSLVSGLISRPELKPIIETAPISQEAICSCVEQRTRNDKYLALLYEKDLDALRAQVANTKFKPYFMGKMMSYVFSCFAPELERSTNSVLPPSDG